MTTQRITPDMLELVTFADVKADDILISFTPSGKDIVIPPTQRQLDRLTWKGADPRRIFTVPFTAVIRPGVREFGTGPDRWTGMDTAPVWRIKH